MLVKIDVDTALKFLAQGGQNDSVRGPRQVTSQRSVAAPAPQKSELLMVVAAFEIQLCRVAIQQFPHPVFFFLGDPG